mmetsp:Transcript_56311/g.148083  ORF Transcript_56311/g.148083 Transcript_56311/m.148083 type:complete len:408 (+) Transcript_56311:185-1408(+)
MNGARNISSVSVPLPVLAFGLRALLIRQQRAPPGVAAAPEQGGDRRAQEVATRGGGGALDPLRQADLRVDVADRVPFGLDHRHVPLVVLRPEIPVAAVREATHCVEGAGRRDGQGGDLAESTSDGGEPPAQRVAGEDHLVAVLFGLRLDLQGFVHGVRPDALLAHPPADHKGPHHVADGPLRKDAQNVHDLVEEPCHERRGVQVHVGHDVLRRARAAHRQDPHPRPRELQDAPAADGAGVPLDLLQLDVVEVRAVGGRADQGHDVLRIVAVDGLREEREIHGRQPVLLLRPLIAPAHGADRVGVLRAARRRVARPAARGRHEQLAVRAGEVVGRAHHCHGDEEEEPDEDRKDLALAAALRGEMELGHAEARQGQTDHNQSGLPSDDLRVHQHDEQAVDEQAAGEEQQ